MAQPGFHDACAHDWAWDECGACAQGKRQVETAAGGGGGGDRRICGRGGTGANKDAEQAKKKKKKQKNKKEQAGGAAAKGNVGVGDSAAGPLKSAAATKGGAGGGQCSATDFMVWLTAVQWELENDGDTDERVVDAHVAALSAFGAEMEGVCRAAVFHLDEASGACELDLPVLCHPRR